MVVESFPDGDGEVLRRLREAFGSEFPIVVTHDFHANISEPLVQDSTALVVYKTNPHVDQRERGVQAAKLLVRTIRGEIKPTQALVKPPMLFNILYQNTSKEPLKSIMDAAREMEDWRKVLVANVAAGYQYADVDEMGPSVVVVTDDDPRLARNAAQRLSDMLWEVREQLVINLPDAATAVRMAVREASSQRPTVLVDMGDNIGGGSAGDSTFILRELHEQMAHGWVMVIADPEAVQEGVQAGVRASVRLRVGGKTDNLHGEPVEVQGRVRCIHDGCYEETEPRHGGKRFHDQGVTIVIEDESWRRRAATFAKELREAWFAWLRGAQGVSHLFKKITMTLQAKECVCLLRNPESGEFTAYAPPLVLTDEELPVLLRAIQNVTEETFRECRPVIVDNAAEDPRLDEEGVAALGIENMLTVPLITETKQGNGGHETTLGVLHVLNKGFGNPFTPEDVRLVGILARQVVEVIVAGQLFTSGTEMTKYLSTPNPLPNYLVLTSQREPPFSLEQLRSLGIKPEKQRILVVKAAIAFRAAYQPIAGRIIEVNTPGLTCIDPKRFDYRRVRRPLFGLE
jgi:microcystin degradation protein MlrC